MAVHSHVERMKIETLAFETRFRDGYRYLDHCGETIVRIRSRNPCWAVTSVNVVGGQLRNDDLNMALNLSSFSMSVNLLKPPIDVHGVEPKVEAYAKEAEAIYEIVTRALRVTETTRVGARFRFVAPADTLEEADRFICRGMDSPLLEKLKESTRSELRDAAVAFVLADQESGHRRRIEIVSQTSQKPGDDPYTGLDGELRTGSVVVDIDTFTRPERGHLERSSLFIQKSYLRAGVIAMELFEWLRLQQPTTRK